MASPLIISLKRQKGFCGSKIRILSPAKVNLYLNIIGKYPGGYHRIESVVERISLSDDILIAVKKDPSVKIISNFKALETKDNLIFKAISFIKKRFKVPFGFDVYLSKNIPIGSGLGGGSSNAASTLLALSNLLRLNVEKKELYFMGSKLGSDVNFFLTESKFAFLEGRGEKATPIKADSRFRHIIIWPGLSISTKKVYARTAGKLTNFFNNANILRYALKKSDCSLIQESIFNALEKRAFLVNSRLKKAKAYLQDKGFLFHLTGSGSAFYAILPFRKDKSDKMTIKKIRKIVPSRWLVFEAQTF